MTSIPDDEPLTLEELESPRLEPRPFRRLHRYYRSEPPAKPVKPIHRSVTFSPLPDLRPADGHFKFDFHSAMSLNQSRFVFKGNPTEKGVAKRIVSLVPVAKKSNFKKPVPPPEKTEYVHLPKHTRRVIDAISSSIVSLPAPLFVAPKMSAPRRLKPVMDSETNSRKRLRETVEELGGEPLETDDASASKKSGNQITLAQPASQTTVAASGASAAKRKRANNDALAPTTPSKKPTLRKSTACGADDSDDDPFKGINPNELYLPASMRHLELAAAKMDVRCPEFDDWPEADYWYPPDEMDRLKGKKPGSAAKPPASTAIKAT
ncbi:hypothetical protein HDU87_000535 [Geranomyces variabilis]|uniref:Uncharacterized protein n=1 Tax=Geranomyces variabilis TaxID=109894 RepID=A0AAD5TDT2_9FUNG|nr:hypothetical protein HDU87_000535 [Geranomyces variabilis]